MKLQCRLLLVAALFCLSAPAWSQTKVLVNEFYRDGNLGTGNEWIEVVLTEPLTAAQLEGFFIGDSTSSTAAKFSGYKFTNMASIAANFPAGTIIVVAGSGGLAADGSYDPGNGDWNLTLLTNGSNITSNGSSGDLAGTDVVYADTNGSNGDTSLSTDGFAVNWDSTPGTFGAVASVTVGVPSNASGVVLDGNLGNATTVGSWSVSVASMDLTPGQPNGGDNTTYINTLRGGTDSAPTVSDTTPADMATDVAISTTIQIGFSEEVSVATPANAFSIECPTSNAVAFTASSSPASVYTLTPSSNLPNGTVCTVTVTAAEVLDTDGTPNAMASNFTFSFTTITANPVVSFTAAGYSQAEGDSGVSNLMFTLDIVPAPTGTVSFNATVTGSGSNPADAADFGAGANFGNPVVVSFDGMSTPPYQVSIPLNGDSTNEPDETFTLTLDNFSGTDGSQTSPISAIGTIINDDFPITAIHDIQGSGSASPIAENTQVKVVGAVVTAVTVSPPAAASGFFMQAKDADADMNLLTSEGIFVFTAGAPTVSVGDEVTVNAEVAEFFGMTQLDNVVSITVTGTGLTLPSPVEFSTATGVPSTDPDDLSCPGTGPGGTNNDDTNFECFEGMRISIPSGLVTSPNLRRAADLYAEAYITTTGNRSRREEGVLFGSATGPGNAAAPIFDGNPEVIEIDADEAGLAITELTSGSTFSAEGVIGYSFGDYEFYPTSFTPIVTAPVPEAVMAAAGGDEMTIASFNTQHLCDDDGGDGCSRDTLGASGALSYADKTAKVADYIVNVLGSPDIIGLQEVDSVTTLQTLAAKISADTAGAVVYSSFLIDGDDPGGIDVGFMTRDGRIQDVAVTQFYKGDTWDDPNGTDILHDRPPLLLQANFIGDGVGGLQPFAVINNHTKARSQVDNMTAAAERDRAKRFYQAIDIANLVQQFQTATGPFSGQGTDLVPLILVGDYNAFEYTDGYVDVLGLITGHYDDAANECNAVLSNGAGTEDCNLGANIVTPTLYNTGFSVPENERISYEFTQNYGVVQGADTRDVPSVQVIDHTLLARTAQGFFLGSDYGIANNAAGVNSGRTNSGPINSSDHDGMVTYLDFDCLNSPELNPDGDMVCGMLDNCPLVSNDDQTDTDMDGIGDACELGDMIFADGFE